VQVERSTLPDAPHEVEYLAHQPRPAE
jgi:hypothetical protein